MNVKRWDIVEVDLNYGSKGSEAKGLIKCIVVSNNKGNKFGPTVIVVPTKQCVSTLLPTQAKVYKDMTRKGFTGVAACEQIRIISKERIVKKIDKVEKPESIEKRILNAVGDLRVKNFKGIDVKRGEVIYMDLSGNLGSEQGSVRPCLVVSNNIGNKYGDTIIVIPIGHKKNGRMMSTHISIKENMFNSLNGGTVDGNILTEQIITLDKSRIKGEPKVQFNKKAMKKVEEVIKFSLAIE